MRGEIQFVSDTFLIEKFAATQSALYKEAGAMDSVLGALNDFVLSKVDASSPGALGASLLDILAPAILFQVSAPLGVAVAVASKMFGFNIKHIWDAIMRPVEPKIRRGEP